MTTATSPRTNWIFVVFFFGLGGLFGWYAWSQAGTHWSLASRGQRTEASIVGHEEVRGRRSTTWYPVFQFAAADGRRIRATSGASAEPAQSPRGSRVTVVYDPARPETVQQASAMDGGLSLSTWILGGLTLLMFALGAAFLWPRRPASAP